MALEHYPMTYQVEELLVIANLVFLVIFTAELLLKVLALGIKGYFQVSWHIFDFIIVIIGLLEILLADVQGLSVLHSFRLVSKMMTSLLLSVLNIHIFPPVCSQLF
ncbi:Sodium channel protein type 4 subunit alpha B [Ameca splendens]|uniref:Sodium channel protein type 4 subunit alpha B n=1 Tax=Ameca splendens TaxID=208324 RepID=A0ABV1A0U1_9TELE